MRNRDIINRIYIIYSTFLYTEGGREILPTMCAVTTMRCVVVGGGFLPSASAVTTKRCVVVGGGFLQATGAVTTKPLTTRVRGLKHKKKENEDYFLNLSRATYSVCRIS